jgi:hypothetical protein
MTTLREAAKMALGALKYINSPLSVIEIDIVGRAIAALDAALEQQAKHDDTYDSLERYTQEIRTILSGAAKRQPLTDEEIINVWKPFEGNPFTTKYEFARAIERAHGIGGEE